MSCDDRISEGKNDICIKPNIILTILSASLIKKKFKFYYQGKKDLRDSFNFILLIIRSLVC